MEKINLKSKKKMKNALIISSVLFVLLIGKIAYIQFIQGPDLIEKAEEQQMMSRSVTPKRGNIYDATRKYILATSSSVEAVNVNPGNIKEEDKEKVAKKLSELFELDYQTILNKVKKRSSIETIAKKVDKEKTKELLEWMNSNGIKEGINIDEDSKRFYPYGSLASQIIGFCGSDNQGLGGLEAKYENILKGNKGYIERLSNAKGSEIGSEGEQYINPIDGNSIVSTIDLNVQSIVEKYLAEACIDNKCSDGGSVIVMNPKNGDILAMATYPNYDLNKPYEINTEELKSTWDSLDNNTKNEALQSMWRNKAIADSYEPGSVFKLITASASLEEGITDTDRPGEFCCTGGITVAGVRIKCWRYYRPHGPESLREALMNSCNPVFIGLGQKLGVHTYYSYLNKFGLLEKTSIDLPGEAKGIFLAEQKVGPVELGTISFGQRFEITPIQMATAISVIANGGNKIEPRMVKETINSQTGEITEIEPKVGERVISEETSKKVLSMMESVVAEGTGKNARVAGYKIGGKTGTSEDGVNTGKYVTSFVGVAPTDDPQIVMLITLYNPTGEGGHQGGGVAAPLGGQILSEILPYLEVDQGNKDQIEEIKQIETPNLIGKTIEEAEKICKDSKLQIKIEGTNGEEIDKGKIVVNQTPQSGIMVKESSCIYIEQ